MSTVVQEGTTTACTFLSGCSEGTMVHLDMPLATPPHSLAHSSHYHAVLSALVLFHADAIMATMTRQERGKRNLELLHEIRALEAAAKARAPELDDAQSFDLYVGSWTPFQGDTNNIS
jgi:hypothetical protein